jgi:hypothetical protein
MNVSEYRPCNEKDAIVFLIMLAFMVVIFSVVKGVSECGKN